MNDQDTVLIMQAHARTIALLEHLAKGSPELFSSTSLATTLINRADELDARRLAGTDTGEGHIPGLRKAHQEEA